MATFKYLKQQAHWFSFEGKEIYLRTGETFEVLQENEYISALVEQGYLERVKAPKKPNRSQSKKST